MRVLVAEDDERVGAALEAALRRHGHAVVRTASGLKAENLALASPPPDLVLLDLTLPDIDGVDVCRRLRTVTDVPILALTGRNATPDRVHGLNAGFDDYLGKPYDLRELLARIDALMRRARPPRAPAPAAPEAAPAEDEGPRGLELDPQRRSARLNGHALDLTRKEFDLLRVLLERPGIVVRREQLLSSVWGSAWPGDARTLQVHVSTLRTKLGVPDAIVAVRGVGYRLDPEAF